MPADGGAPHGTRDRGRRSGRRPGSTETRQDILRAARKLFAENGYGGATMRTIAREANVDAALIHHFFVSKEGVFAAAIEESMRLPQLVDSVLWEGGEELGKRLVLGFLGLWNDPETRDPMLAVIRSAVTYEEAAQLLRDFIADHVIARVATASSHGDARFRGTLIGSHLVGLALLRYVIKIEPLASMPDEAVATFVASTIDRYLTADVAEFEAQLAAPAQDAEL